MKLDDRIKEFNTELARLKKLIPGLQCSDEMLVHRGEPYILIGYVDEADITFVIDYKTEEPQVLAQRVLDGHITLMNRLHDNVVALEKLVEGNRKENGGNENGDNSG